MHDDNNVWMKQIKKLKKESIFAKLKEKKKNLQLVNFEVQRRKKEQSCNMLS